MNALHNSGTQSQVATKIGNIDSFNAYHKIRIFLQRKKHYIEQKDIISKRIRALRREAASEPM